MGGQHQTKQENMRELDGTATAEEHDYYHRDAYMNDRKHASVVFEEGSYKTARLGR